MEVASDQLKSKGWGWAPSQAPGRPQAAAELSDLHTHRFFSVATRLQVGEVNCPTLLTSSSGCHGNQHHTQLATPVNLVTCAWMNKQVWIPYNLLCKLPGVSAMAPEVR